MAGSTQWKYIVKIKVYKTIINYRNSIQPTRLHLASNNKPKTGGFKLPCLTIEATPFQLSAGAWNGRHRFGPWMIGSSCCSCCPESCGYLSNILIIWNMYTRFLATRINQGNLWQVRSLKKKMTELQTNLGWAWVSIAKKWCRTLSHQEPKDILCSLFRPNKGAKELRKEWLFYSGPSPKNSYPNEQHDDLVGTWLSSPECCGTSTN